MSAEAMVFTFLACSDLKRIADTIGTPPDLWSASVSDNLAMAEDFAGQFARHCQGIAENPPSGTARDELQPGLRSSVFRRYTIFYRIRGERVEVVRVLRSSQDPGQST